MSKKMIVKLLNPDMCQYCRFSENIEMRKNNTIYSMIKCNRKDCDNWDYNDIQYEDENIFKEQ